MDTIDACYVSTAVPDGLIGNGTATEGRKGIAYLRDYFVPATPAGAVARERVSA